MEYLYFDFDGNLLPPLRLRFKRVEKTSDGYAVECSEYMRRCIRDFMRRVPSYCWPYVMYKGARYNRLETNGNTLNFKEN